MEIIIKSSQCRGAGSISAENTDERRREQHTAARCRETQQSFQSVNTEHTSLTLALPARNARKDHLFKKKIL